MKAAALREVSGDGSVLSEVSAIEKSQGFPSFDLSATLECGAMLPVGGAARRGIPFCCRQPVHESRALIPLLSLGGRRVAGVF